MTAAEGIIADPTAVAERVVALVRARAASAEAESVVRTGVSALTRFANSRIHQNVAEELGSVSVRVALDGRIAATTLEGPTTDERLERLVDEVLAVARVRPVDRDWPGIPAPSAGAAVDHWDEATAQASPADRAARVAAFVRAAGQLETAGFCSTDALRTAYVNSAGQALEGKATIASLHGIARTASSDGSARSASARLADVDGGATGTVAAAKARSGADPTDLEPGRYEVVLEPDCVADLVGFLMVYGYNGLTVAEQRSFVRLGEAQLDPAIDLRDDATDPAHVGVAFDTEGTSRGRTDVVLQGISTAVIHSRRTAARAGGGATSTGHGGPGSETWGALPSNIVLGAGSRPAARLIEAVKRGLLVTNLWYTRVLDPRTLVVTGLTRNGVWLIEDGRIVRPVRNLRFTQSYAEALAPGNVLGIGDDPALVPGHWDDPHALVPTLHLAAWNFTGNART